MKYLKLKNDKLHTPIIQYRKNDLTFTSIGAIHIGMEEYYDRLQKEMDRIPFGFYEGIKKITNEKNVIKSRRKYISEFQNLNKSYKQFANYLEISTQKENLTYPKNWENPDVTLEELINKSPEKFLLKILKLEKELDKLEEIYETNPKEVVATFRGVMKCMAKFPLFASVFSLITNGPTTNKIIMHDRNQMLFDAIEKKLIEPEAEEYGTIYGAAHLPGLDKYLRRTGFNREGEEWIHAWDLESEMPFFEALKIMKNDIVERKK